MHHLILKLQQHVEFGIKNYESLVGNEKVSDRRKKDILNIRKILYQPHHDLDHKMKAVKKYLENLKTGWGIFRTGHSQLKNLILYEMKVFKTKHVNQFIPLETYFKYPQG